MAEDVLNNGSVLHGRRAAGTYKQGIVEILEIVEKSLTNLQLPELVLRMHYRHALMVFKIKMKKALIVAVIVHRVQVAQMNY